MQMYKEYVRTQLLLLCRRSVLMIRKYCVVTVRYSAGEHKVAAACELYMVLIYFYHLLPLLTAQL
jgi:hypothetical protein